jgi:hypothetical protein
MTKDTDSSLNGFAIAALAMVTSTAVAIAIYFGLRRKSGRLASPPGQPTAARHSRGRADVPAPPGRPSRAPGAPDHFSENLILPGFTQTGDEISEQDARQGRSTEGV